MQEEETDLKLTLAWAAPLKTKIVRLDNGSILVNGAIPVYPEGCQGLAEHIKEHYGLKNEMTSYWSLIFSLNYIIQRSKERIVKIRQKIDFFSELRYQLIRTAYFGEPSFTLEDIKKRCKYHVSV